MQRLLRILVLALAVIPLGLSGAQLLPPAGCVAQMAPAHMCCAQHAEIATPSCCNAKADTFLAEGSAAAGETLTNVARQAVLPMLLQRRDGTKSISEAHPAYIPILVPALILRT